jgi:DNA-binding transcriptional ArsR family regulator
VIQLRLTVADLGQLRFAYSPLAEAAESLYMLSARRLPDIHRGWFDDVRDRLGDIDLDLLLTAVPGRSYMADFLFGGATSPQTSIEQQIAAVAAVSPEHFRREFAAVWTGGTMPPVIKDLVADPGGARRLANELWKYWTVAFEPRWRAMRAVFDDDVTHRAAELTKGGATAMVADLHPEISIQGEMLRIDRLALPGEEMTTAGVLLVPSAFSWPNVVFATGAGGPACLIYPARGVGNLWGRQERGPEDDALSSLLGRSRAAILSSLALPRSTTELAVELGQSPPAVSQHLAVLRRSGLVISWRAGRSVMYRRTPLGTSVVEADGTTIAETGNGSAIS